MKKKLIIIPILAVLIVTIGARYTAATAETPAVPSRMAASPVFTAALSWDTTRAEQDAETTPWDVLPAGTVVYIDGLGQRIVQDYGEAIKGNAVDLYFADHDAALAFGRQNVRLYIADTGDTL